MFEKEAEEYTVENVCSSCYFEKPCENKCEAFGCADSKTYVLKAFKDGAEYGYNKANEWFDARTSIPVPKKAEIYRYTLEAISDKGDIVCYDYKDKDWKKLVIDNEKVTYVPVEVEMWCNKPTKESE